MSRLVIIFLLYPIMAGAQPKRFENYTIHDGLSQSTVRCILQDETGFIWMGTQDGLNRFDGKNFRTLRKTSKGHASLSHNNINQIISIDKKLWIATNGGGINIYDEETDSVTRINHQKQNEKTLADDNISALLYTSAKEVWVGSEHGITVIDPKSQVVNFVITDFNSSSPAISSLAEDKNHKIWVATRHDGVYIFDSFSKTQVHHIPKKKLGLSSQNIEPVRHVFRDKADNIWISTNKGLFMHKGASDSLELKKITLKTGEGDFTNEVITCCIEDHDGNFWIGTHNGVLILERGNAWCQHYNQNPNNPYGLSDRAILSIYEDKNNIVWIGTYNGINKYFRDVPRFRSYKTDIRDRYKHLNVVRSIYTEDDQHIFVGTVNSLALFDLSTETIQYIKDSQGNNLQDVFCIARDLDGELWSGNDNGFQKVSKTPNGYSIADAKDHPELDIFKGEQVTQCIPIDKERYLLATFTESGLFVWNKQRRTIKNLRSDPQNKNSLANNKVNQIHISAKGKIWIATNEGVSEFHGATESFTNLYRGQQIINGILEGDENILWLASNDGLIEFNFQSQKSKIYTEDEGLSNNTLYSCLRANDSALWMSSNKGISEFNIRTKQFTNYDVSDGLQSNEYNQYAWYASSSGKLYFGGMEGFDVLTLPVANPQVQPPLVVTNIRVIEKNKFADLYPIQNQTLRLRYFQNAIGFDYALLDFSSPGRNEFLCKLEGFDEGWIDNGKNTAISYTNLPPGDYSFLVKTKGNSAEDASAKYAFTILAPFWQTRWFTVMLVIVTLALLALIIRSYYKRKFEKQRLMFEKQQAIAHERTRIATDMHDDLGAGLSRIKFLSESIGLKSLQRETITEEVHKIKEYSHDMIDKMGEIVWALNKKNDSLSDLISYTRSYAAEYLAQNNIECSITTPDEVPALIVSGEFRRNLFLVVKEALHNIVKHAKAEQVTIDIVIDQKLFITLNDNGNGFELNNRRTGNGISNMHNRMKDVAGGFEIRNHNGTSVRLWAPLPL